MAKRHSLLSRVYIAAPCNASWDAMEGDEQVRFCKECKLNVYNLSAMTSSAAEKLILEKEGKLCARIFRRSDGTIITENCPVGLRWLRNQIKFAYACIAFFLSWLLSGGMLTAQELSGLSSSKNKELQRFDRYKIYPDYLGSVSGNLRILSAEERAIALLLQREHEGTSLSQNKTELHSPDGVPVKDVNPWLDNGCMVSSWPKELVLRKSFAMVKENKDDPNERRFKVSFDPLRFYKSEWSDPICVKTKPDHLQCTDKAGTLFIVRNKKTKRLSQQ